MSTKKKYKKRHSSSKKPQTKPPKKATTVIAMVLKIYLIHVAAFIVYTAFCFAFINSDYKFLIATIASVIIYLGLCYIVALRAGNRDRKYEEYSGIPIDGRNGLRAAVISQITGLIIAIVFQFTMPEKLQYIYEFLYMPFAYVTDTFKAYSRLIYFLPLIFAPIMFAFAYLTGRSALLPEQKPKFVERMEAAQAKQKKKH